jgi:hypothetical protein
VLSLGSFAELSSHITCGIQFKGSDRNRLVRNLEFLNFPKESLLLYNAGVEIEDGIE